MTFDSFRSLCKSCHEDGPVNRKAFFYTVLFWRWEPPELSPSLCILISYINPHIYFIEIWSPHLSLCPVMPNFGKNINSVQKRDRSCFIQFDLCHHLHIWYLSVLARLISQKSLQSGLVEATEKYSATLNRLWTETWPRQLLGVVFVLLLLYFYLYTSCT